MNSSSKATPAGKACVHCETIRAAHAFFPTPFSPDGLSERCRECTFSTARADRVAREARNALAR